MPYEVVDSPRARLGECPIWCEHTERLWWVDVLAPKLWSYDPAAKVCKDHPVTARRIGSVALRSRGGLVLACDDGLYSYDPETGDQQFLMDPEPDAIGHRKNDGRVDWAGNFWIGTLREADYAPVGAIYRVDPELGVERIRGDLAIPNGLAFDEILGRAYYADTRAYAIWVRDYDAANSTLGDERLFARTQAPARPDGSCLDSEGHIWNAEYAGGRLVRFAPDGQISQEINLPFTYPTCCCFGGKDFDKLFVTSASEPLSAEECSHQPLAGHTLVLDVGVRGRPEWRTSI